jgi:hypothetical protein
MALSFALELYRIFIASNYIYMRILPEVAFVDTAVLKLFMINVYSILTLVVAALPIIFKEPLLISKWLVFVAFTGLNVKSDDFCVRIIPELSGSIESLIERYALHKFELLSKPNFAETVLISVRIEISWKY